MDKVSEEDNNSQGAKSWKPLTRFTHGLYSAGLLQQLDEMRKNGMESSLCDVVLVVGGQDFPAHRVVLAAGSPYFRAMFGGRLREKEMERVEIFGVSSTDAFRRILDFIYSGEVQVDKDGVLDLLQTADMMQVRQVVLSCSDFLKRELDPCNCLGILRVAEVHDCPMLADAAFAYACEHFVLLTAEQEFLDADVKVINRLINSENLRIDGEAQVLNGAMAWFRKDLEERRRYIFDLLPRVRFPLIPVKVLEECAEKETDASLRVAVRSMINDFVSRRGSLVNLNVEPRACARKIIYLFGGAKREMISSWTKHECTLETVMALDASSLDSPWRQICSMELGRIHPGVCVLGRKIYVFGGEQDSQILANGECFDPAENAWIPVSPMVVPRCEFGLCAFGSSLYAFGGWVGEDLGGSIECYCPETDSWSMLGEMPARRFSMGVVAHQELVYVVGGCTQRRRHVKDLQAFNPVTNEWTDLAPMLVPRSQMGVCVLEDHLYVVGGTNKDSQVLASVERYSFEEGTWELVPDMNQGRANPAVAAANGRLFVIGGERTMEVVDFYRAQVTLSDVEVFDPSTCAWTTIASLPDSRSEAGVAVL